MESMAEVEGVGFEEGKVWLPAHVLDEACELKEDLRQQNHRRANASLPAEPVVHRYQHSFSKSSSKLYQSTQRFPLSRASGGPGMQAVFLGSDPRSCGTGFFLPRKRGNNFQPNKKPACSPVLLPSRVVQALNLNVHALGSQLTTQRDVKNSVRGGSRDSIGNKSESDIVMESVSTTQCCVASHARSSSPEIFLPKEWSY